MIVSQKNIVAAGHVAGGDITEINIGGHYIEGGITANISYTLPSTRLGGLIEQLREKIGKDPEAVEFVERLLWWINPKSTELKRSLPDKLTDCDKSYLIYDALEAKELFAKQLKRTTFSPAVQEIYAYILGDIHTYFNLRIKPIIASTSEVGGVENAIYNLTNSISTQIANAPPELGIGTAEIVGMLYYLTGNCHLEWDYK